MFVRNHRSELNTSEASLLELSNDLQSFREDLKRKAGHKVKKSTFFPAVCTMRVWFKQMKQLRGAEMIFFM